MQIREDMQVIAQGAEAIVYKTKILNQDVCIKERISKKYRNPVLDKRIIKARNKEEAFLLNKVKDKLNTPIVFYVSENKIVLEYIKNQETHEKHLEKIGSEIAKMHNENVIHGDINLINIIINKKKVYFIDFGLGFVSRKIEDKATDLLVFKKTLNSLKKTENYWKYIKKGYLTKTNQKQIIKQIEDIEKRGRYL
jgi:bifunctional N6-L-threonylcarbamoyladenine synthase / protein kinase Bud32